MTVYPVRADPLDAGAVQASDAVVNPVTVALTAIGASGAVAASNAAEAGEEAEVPTAFVAETAKVYEVPEVRPVTLAEVPDTAMLTPADGVAVTAYPVMA